MTKRYYEDFAIGERFVTPSRTVGESQVNQWAGLSGDFNEIHMSSTFAERSPFGRRIAHGGVGFAIATGMCNSLWDEGGRAALGVKWDFIKPIAFGDTVHCEVEVLEKEPTRSRHGGSIRFAVSLLNQNDVIVQSGEMLLLFYERPAPPAVGGDAPAAPRLAQGSERKGASAS